MEQGLEKGELRKAIETARRMKKRRFTILEIVVITGLLEFQLREFGIL